MRQPSRRQRVEAVFARVAEIPPERLQLRADFACYLCVVVSGFVEAEIASIARSHSRTRASDTVFNFVDSRLTRPGNLNAERLLQMVGTFSPEWRDQLEQYISGERRDALDSVVANRNSIAHGESVGLTYDRMRGYFGRVREVVDFVEGLFMA